MQIAGTFDAVGIEQRTAGRVQLAGVEHRALRRANSCEHIPCIDEVAVPGRLAVAVTEDRDREVAVAGGGKGPLLDLCNARRADVVGPRPRDALRHGQAHQQFLALLVDEHERPIAPDPQFGRAADRSGRRRRHRKRDGLALFVQHGERRRLVVTAREVCR